MPTSRKTLTIGILGLVFVIILIVVSANWQTVFDQLSHANGSYLIPACVLLIAGYLMYAARWRSLLSNKPRLRTTFHAANMGNLLNTSLPLRPGDAARIFILWKKEEIPWMEVASSVVVERWVEQILRLVAFGGAIIFGFGPEVSNATILGTLAFLVGFFVFMTLVVQRRELVLSRFPPWLARLPGLTEDHTRKGLESLIDGLAGISSIPRLFGLMVWSIVCWSFFWGFHYLCLLSLDQSLDTQTVLALSLGSLALVPPSASTLPGVYQVSMIAPLTLVGFNENLLVSYSLIMNFTEIILIIGLGFWGIMQTGISLRQLSRQEITPLVSEKLF